LTIPTAGRSLICAMRSSRAGRVAFPSAWRGAAENDWVRLPMDAIKGIVPPTAPPDPEAPGPIPRSATGGRGGSHPDGGRLQPISLSRPSMLPFPVWRGARRGTRPIDRRGEDGRSRSARCRARASLIRPDDIRAPRLGPRFVAAFAGRPGERSVMIDRRRTVDRHGAQSGKLIAIWQGDAPPRGGGGASF